jgi:hypothetical protein
MKSRVLGVNMKYFVVLLVLLFPYVAYSQDEPAEDMEEEVEEIEDDPRTWDEITNLLKGIKDVVVKDDEPILELEDIEDIKDAEDVKDETIEGPTSAEVVSDPE